MIDERVALHLAGMRKAAENAVSLVERISFDDFVKDENAQAATAMFLIIIGEAATKVAQLSPAFVESYPALPWEKMRGLRNRIVHDYETLHLPTIWATARESLPELLVRIDAISKPNPL